MPNNSLSSTYGVRQEPPGKAPKLLIFNAFGAFLFFGLAEKGGVNL